MPKRVTLLSVKTEVGKARSDLKALQTTTKGLALVVDQLGKEAVQTSEQNKKLSRQLNRIERAMYKARQQSDQYARSVRVAKVETRGLGAAVGRMSVVMGGAIGIVYALGRAISYGTSKGLSFNRQLTIIQKTTKLSVEEMGRLEDRIKGIARTRGIDRDEVAAAGVIGGRLGIADVDDLTKLVDVGVAIDKSTDLDAARAVEVLARIHTLTNTPIKKINETADALVHLGNKAPIGEAAVADLAVRLAAAQGIFAATPKDIIATAGALAIAEGQAEGAATFFHKLYTAISIVAEEGGVKLEKLAGVMDMTGEQLTKSLKTDFIDSVFDFMDAMKQFDQVSQIRIFSDIFDLNDIRGLRAFFRVNPTLRQTLELSRQADGATDVEERIRLQQVSGEFDTSVEAVKAGFLAVTANIDAVLLPAFNALATAVNEARAAAEDEAAARKESIELVDAVRDPSTSRMRAQAIAAARAADAGDLTPGASRAILSLVSPDGFDPSNEGLTPSRQALEDAIYIRYLDQKLRSGRLDFETRAQFAEELNALISPRAQNAIDEIIEEAPPGEVASGGQVFGNRKYDGAGALDLLAILGIGRSAVGGGRGRAAGQEAAAAALFMRRQREHYISQLQASVGPGVEGGRGSARGQREAQQRINAQITRDLQERQDAADRAHEADMEMQRREAEDERRLMMMVRRRATEDEIGYEEDRLRLQRDYADARLRLEGDALDRELAFLDRRAAELERRSPEAVAKEELEKEQEEWRAAVRAGIIDPLEEVIRGNSSIGDAWDAMMNKLAAHLLEENIMKPFRENMSFLINSVLNEVFGQVGAGGATGGLGGLLGGITGYPSSGPPIGSPGSSTGYIPGLADGGVVRRAGLALVGENGPELLSLRPPAMVSPLGAGGALGNVFNFTYNIQSEDDVAIERAIQRNLPMIKDYTQQQLENNSGNNSSFAQALRR